MSIYSLDCHPAYRNNEALIQKVSGCGQTRYWAKFEKALWRCEPDIEQFKLTELENSIFTVPVREAERLATEWT